MKRAWIEYSNEWRPRPLTYWTHGHIAGDPRETDPALKPVAGRGWPTFFVEFDGFTFRFASLAELDACVVTLSRKVLPSPSRLAAERGNSHGHANQHWLSRLPAEVKEWKYRQEAVKVLASARKRFAAQIASAS